MKKFLFISLMVVFAFTLQGCFFFAYKNCAVGFGSIERTPEGKITKIESRSPIENVFGIGGLQ